MYARESCKDIIKHLDIQILPENYIEVIHFLSKNIALN